MADEMGMGKSLSMLALIMYTLHDQGSDGAKDGRPLSQRDGIWSPATLIVAPKSSKPAYNGLWSAFILINRNSHPKLGTASPKVNIPKTDP